LRGDVLAMLCARALAMETVVTPVSSNSMVEKGGFFRRVERTRIGSPFVIKAMAAALADGEAGVCGYEANGGFLLATPLRRGSALMRALPTRDAVLPILAVLEAAQGGSVRALVDALPKIVTHSDRIPDFEPARRDALMGWMLDGDQQNQRFDEVFAPIAGASLAGVDVTDGVRMTFGNGRIIHLRGSGNAPELRCYSEAEHADIAQNVGKAALAWVLERF
jgi:phosphomannomutase